MIKGLFLVLSITLSFYTLGEQISCQLDKQLLPEYIIKIQNLRDRTHSTCLSCIEDECSLNEWPKQKAGDARICQMLFCTATNVSKFVKTPENATSGKTQVGFEFFISKKGKIKGINIVSSKGSMNDRQSFQYIKNFSKKTTFEPLKVNGELKELGGLYGEIAVILGSKEDINKYMPVNQGIWRN
tara:strand:+ start:25790 stop:26344 length:555 start_codon:yes stop_codon:yes gene_type:complete